MNRDEIRRMMRERADEIAEVMEEERRETADNDEFGSPEALITHAVDVRDFVDRKRASMVAHESQIGPETFFLKMPPEAFRQAFGTEWYIELGAARAPDAPFGSALIDDRA
jgi:LmbE family N-acetylglucosaminyl deacetylase